MLLRFCVENFKSIRDRVELSMLPGRVRSHSGHVIRPSNSRDLGALKTSIVYGANASGKSNLIKAMWHAQAIILNSSKAGKNLPFEPFRLDKKCAVRPSRFEFEIKVGKANYAYGFAADQRRVHEEWLYEIDKQKEKLIFERQQVDGQTTFELSGLSLGSKEDDLFLSFTAKGTPDNRLFLTECFERNVLSNLSSLTALIDVNHWFREKLSIVFPRSKYHGLEMAIHSQDESSRFLTNILNAFDTGVDNLAVMPVDLEKDLPEIPEAVKMKIVEELGEKESIFIAGPNNSRYQILKDGYGEFSAFKLMTKHLDTDGEPVYFDINEESDGTQRLLDIAPGLLDIFHQDKVFIIDELDRSLHPQITTSLISSFLALTCDIHSQLIVTTHESNLLNLDLVRRDEIWFAQKDKQGVSSLYSLEEYQPRFDKDIRKGYLVGRFGGVPVIRELFSNIDGCMDAARA